MDPVVASSLISLAGVGTSNIANILMNSHNNKQNAKQWKEYANLQRELQSSQNAWNLAQWNRQNEYNSPANQMNLLRQAGLNPNLVYGNLSGASAGSLESAGADISSPTPNNAAQVSGFGDLGVQIGNQMMQKELNDANIEKINTEVESQRIQNAKDQKELDNWDNTYKNQQENIQASTDSIRQNIEVAKVSLNKLNAEIGLLDEQKRAQVLDNLYNERTFHYRVRQVFQQYELNEAELRVLNATVSEIWSRVSVNKAQVGLLKSQTKLTEEQRFLVASQIAMNKQTMSWNHVLNEAQLEQILESVALQQKQGELLDKDKKYYLLKIVSNALGSFVGGVLGTSVGSKLSKPKQIESVDWGLDIQNPSYYFD